jgi:hypothetical protein
MISIILRGVGPRGLQSLAIIISNIQTDLIVLLIHKARQFCGRFFRNLLDTINIIHELLDDHFQLGDFKKMIYSLYFPFFHQSHDFKEYKSELKGFWQNKTLLMSK